MKIINQFLILICFTIATTSASFAQKSIKQTQQKTDFFYTQLNLNSKISLDDDPSWTFSETSPYSNLNFTYRSKNQTLLQKGYTRFLHIGGSKANLALVYKNLKDDNGASKGALSLQMRDVWLQVNTKWDRTSVRLGYFQLPYGHAPKIDLDNSFIAGLAGQDLGFNRDLGVLFRTPINRNFDIEASFTSGGAMSSTLHSFTMNNESEYPVQNQERDFFDYQNNWLATARLGNATFNKNEIGLFASVGKIRGTSVTDEQSHVYRLGGDWTYKYKERLRITNQILAGYTVGEFNQRGFNINQKIEADLFLKRTFILSFSNVLQYQDYMITHSSKGIVVASLSYAFNPHTRLKLNIFSKYNLKDKTQNPQNPSVFLQVITGFGQRS